ncbi:CHAT domain-containing protein, partial [Mycena pura]
ALNALSSALLSRFRKTGNVPELHEAIILLRQLVELHPFRVSSLCAALLAPTPGELVDRGMMAEAEDLLQSSINSDNKALQLAEHGRHHMQVFLQSGNINELEAAVPSLKKAQLQLTWGHPSRAGAVNNLAKALHERFKLRRDEEDLNSAHALQHEVLVLASQEDPNRHVYVYNLGDIAQTQFLHTRDARDLDRMITLQRQALDLHPSPHPSRIFALDKMASALRIRYMYRADGADLDSAVDLYREILLLRPTGHPRRPFALSNLASCIAERFTLRGDVVDLDSAFELYREALALPPSSVSSPMSRAALLNNVADTIVQRFAQQGDPADLDSAINLYHESLSLRPVDDLARAPALQNLGHALYRRFGHRGNHEDLESAIKRHYEALAFWSDVSHIHRGTCLNNLANELQLRSNLTGNLEDLSRAITLHEEALSLRPQPHSERGRSLGDLGTAYYDRFMRAGNVADLDHAISLLREALTSPVQHANRRGSIRLSNLAGGLHERFNQQKNILDLKDALELKQEALDLWGDAAPDRAAILRSLSRTHQERYQQLRKKEDHTTAVDLFREAAELANQSHPHDTIFLMDLANALASQESTLDEAIAIYREVLAKEPKSHMALHNLGRALGKRGDVADLEAAMTAFREASTYPSSSLPSRFSAARAWAYHAHENRHASALEAYRMAINLVTQLASIGLDLRARGEGVVSGRTRDLAQDAAACAIQSNDLAQAVELLESGRSIVWAQQLQLRTPLEGLYAADASLARRVSELLGKLEQGSARDGSIRMLLSARSPEHNSLDAETQYYRKLVADWAQVVEQVRSLAGFQDFLRTKRMATLRNAAVLGPVVILLASSFLCGALIVRKSEDVQYVPLPDITLHTVESLAGFLRALAPNEAFGMILAALWKSAVKPVIRAMKLEKSSKPPRVWWCPTGPFAFIPIHAAGLYGTLDSECVADYVVSSYTPTLAALLDPPNQPARPFKMTALIQPHTVNRASLPGTEKELERIEGRVPRKWLTSLGRTSSITVEMALSHLSQSSIAHFACHGVQDPRNPLDSGIDLTDGRLKVSTLIRSVGQIGLQQNRALAFLSACETARGDINLRDETMHLAASLLYAGFRGVVGTMWLIQDADGPEVADMFYDFLFRDSAASGKPPDLARAAEALHYAMTEMQKKPDISFTRWVPFVHYG